MNFVRQWPLRRTRARPGRWQRTQKFRPAFFDHPSNHGLGKSFAQCAGRGQRVDDVTHGTEPHDQQPFNLYCWMARPACSLALFPEPLNELGCGVIFGIADDLNSAAAFADNIALGHRVRGVIGAFGLHVWANLAY